MNQEPYNEVDLLYTLMTYVNVSSSQDMYYTIAQTILTHLDIIPTISINDLAELCFTSPATISRFCKDINCKNFANFKTEMAIALELTNNEIFFTHKQQEKINENPQYLVDKIYDDTIRSLKKGKENIKIEDIDKMCEMIHNASKVHFYGYQFNKILANDFQLKLLKLKKFIYAFVERGDEIQRLDLIDENSLVVILSVRARAELINSLVDKVKETHPKIMLITLNKEYVNDNIDYIYRLEGNESDYTQSSMQGTISFASLLNVIYTRYGILYKK
jgi:DNA-binding MurR/RpiR family transcriptional regulator